MGKFKHTPGPWDVTTIEHSSGGGGAVPSTLFRVAFVSQKDFTGHVADKCHGDSYANACLIHAAPYLLKALVEISNLPPERMDEASHIANVALAKADGAIDHARRIEGDGE